MHIGEVITRAWKITWRYKILWLFGLFAAEASSGGSANFNTSSFNNNGSGSNPFTGNAMAGWDAFRTAMMQLWPLLLGLALLLIVLSIAWWIVSIAARGGLVRMVDDGDEGRPVRAADGWSTGFHYWGRVFLQQIVFGVPVFIVVVVIAGLFVLLLGGTIAPIIEAAKSGGPAGSAMVSRILGLVAGSCGLFLIAFVVLFGLGILYFVWVPLSLRFAILYDRPAVKAIGDGWNLLRARLGKVALAGVVVWGLTFVYGIAVGIFSLMFLLPVIGFVLARVWFVVAAMGLVWFVIVVAAGAVFSAFYSAYWTIAFRRIMDRGPEGVALEAGLDAAAADAGAGAGYLPDVPAAPAAPAAVPGPPVAPTADLGPGLDDQLITQPAGDGSSLPEVAPPAPPATSPAPEAAPPAPPAPPAVPRPPRRSDLPNPPATPGSEG